jgi:hypothetical protein
MDRESSFRGSLFVLAGNLDHWKVLALKQGVQNHWHYFKYQLVL